MTPEPRTEAGRRTVDRYGWEDDHEDLIAEVLAIESEAALTNTAELLALREAADHVLNDPHLGYAGYALTGGPCAGCALARSTLADTAQAATNIEAEIRADEAGKWAEADAIIAAAKAEAVNDWLASEAAVERLAEALQSTILTSPDAYMGPGMGAYRTPYDDLTPQQQRHVQGDAKGLLDALLRGKP